MIKVKPSDGTNPGFAAIKATAIADINYSSTSITVKGEKVDDVTKIDFIGKDKGVFASMNDYGRALASIVLIDDGKRTLGSFLKGETSLEFPTKGTMYTEPIDEDWARGTSSSGRDWQLHRIILKGVKFKDFKLAKTKA